MVEQVIHDMSERNEFVKETIRKGEADIYELKKLKEILDELYEEPQVLYTSYNIKSNA